MFMLLTQESNAPKAHGTYENHECKGLQCHYKMNEICLQMDKLDIDDGHSTECMNLAMTLNFDYNRL